MKKKFTSLKTLLVAAALCVGGSSAWAAVGDVTTNANIDFSNAISNNTVAGTKNSMTLSGNFELGYTSGETTTLGDVLRVGNGTGTVTIADEELAGTRDEVVITFDMYFGSLSGKKAGFYLYDASDNVIAGFYQEYYNTNVSINSFNFASRPTSKGSSAVSDAGICVASNKTTFELYLNYASGTMYGKWYTNGTLKETSTPTAMGSTNPLKKFVVQSDYNNTGRRCWFDNLIIQTTEGDYSVSSAEYTVNWVCGSAIVKTDTRTGDVGSPITLYSTDDDSFFVGETKYMYVSDDAEGKTVTEGDATVVTITVKEPALYNYTVNAVDASENILAVLASSSVYEDDNSATTHLPWYVLKDGTLYYQGSNSNTTSITADGQVVKIAYAENKTNVVYYAEAENISGGTEISLANGSNYAGSRALNNVKFTTLEAGKYKIYSRFNVGNGTAGTTYAANPFTVGETPLVYNVPAKTNTSYESEEFIVAEETDLYVTFAGSSISGVDYIFIQKTGDVKNLTSTAELEGYKTFYNASKSFEVDANTTIYKAAQVSGDKVVITAVEGKIIPAGEAVILKTTDAGYAITLTETTTASAGDFTGNALQAAASAGVLSGAYILAYTTADGLGFYEFTGSLDAGDVYVTAAGAAKLRISVEDEMATSIQAIATEDVKSNVIYNLNGQRVVKPLKGIYIQNGKKILVK